MRDLVELRRIARAALAVTSLAATVGDEPWRLDGWPQEVVDFIAAFDPPTVLALLDEVEPPREGNADLAQAFVAAQVERYGTPVPEMDPEWAEEVALAWIAGRLRAARSDVASSLLEVRDPITPPFSAIRAGCVEPVFDAALSAIRRALGLEAA